MAVGDVKTGMSMVATQNGVFTIQPPVGEEWVIHNIYYSQGVSIRIISGGQTCTIDTDTSSGARLGTCFHLTNTHYISILNTYNGGNAIGYDGIQTK